MNVVRGRCRDRVPPHERAKQPRQTGFRLKRLDSLAQRGMHPPQLEREHRIDDDRLGEPRRAGQPVGQQFRGRVHDPVDETRHAGRPPGVRLARLKNHHAARPRVMQRPTVADHLHALGARPDGELPVQVRRIVPSHPGMQQVKDLSLRPADTRPDSLSLISRGHGRHHPSSPQLSTEAVT